MADNSLVSYQSLQLDLLMDEARRVRFVSAYLETLDLTCACEAVKITPDQGREFLASSEFLREVEGRCADLVKAARVDRDFLTARVLDVADKALAAGQLNSAIKAYSLLKDIKLPKGGNFRPGTGDALPTVNISFGAPSKPELTEGATDAEYTSLDE
jgi:hypothetical protein